MQNQGRLDICKIVMFLFFLIEHYFVIIVRSMSIYFSIVYGRDGDTNNA